MLKDFILGLDPAKIDEFQKKAPGFIKMVKEKMHLIEGFENSFRQKFKVPEDEIIIYSALPVIKKEDPENNDLVIYVFSVKQLTEDQGNIKAGSMLITNQLFKFNVLPFVDEIAKGGIKGLMDNLIDISL